MSMANADPAWFLNDPTIRRFSGGVHDSPGKAGTGIVHALIRPDLWWR